MFSSQVGNYFKPARASRLMAQAQETQRATSKSLSCFEKTSPPVLPFLDFTFLRRFHIFAPNTFHPSIFSARKSTTSLVFWCLLHAFVPVGSSHHLFDQLDQTKQSPRNAKSAATQIWGNLKPVGNVRLLFVGKISGKSLLHPGDRWGKAGQCSHYWENIVPSPCLKFPKKEKIEHWTILTWTSLYRRRAWGYNPSYRYDPPW